MSDDAMNRVPVGLFPRLLIAIIGIAFASLSSGAFSADRTAPWVGTTLDGRQCQARGNDQAIKFDYITDKSSLQVVERFHFTPEVEQLIRGNTTASPIKDIDYTLIKYPNHPRALYSAVRFSLSNAPQQLIKQYPAECYLQRAMQFSRGDPVPPMLFGLYLHRLGKLDQSLSQYRIAEKLAPNDPNLMYNLGLLLYDQEKYEESYRYAKRAYDLGLTFPALKKKLQDAGYWN